MHANQSCFYCCFFSRIIYLIALFCWVHLYRNKFVHNSQLLEKLIYRASSTKFPQRKGLGTIFNFKKGTFRDQFSIKIGTNLTKKGPLFKNLYCIERQLGKIYNSIFLAKNYFLQIKVGTQKKVFKTGNLNSQNSKKELRNHF